MHIYSWQLLSTLAIVVCFFAVKKQGESLITYIYVFIYVLLQNLLF